MRLTPRDTRFYDMFTEQAAHLLLGAAILLRAGRRRHERGRRSPSGCARPSTTPDETTHLIMSHGQLDLRHARSTARTSTRSPAHLDDVMDAMEAAVDLVVLYGVDELPEEFAEQVEVLNARGGAHGSTRCPGCAR